MSKRERSGDERVKIKSEKIYIYFFFFFTTFFPDELFQLSCSKHQHTVQADGTRRK